ncbi:unnamed protein product [Lepeophtheirus salmonis]|uniref:(salmon louse) hypothetical protein n=1 Tax=Lepeophtheirus salmonis TaxID=72036 RepID=A0A7R8CX17_LEPSM|nr:unnamed protein product [Lepeophtheirus salmonis]CAF2957125.1 unnamed protein product [Lepeophtheirus salmonis]
MSEAELEVQRQLERDRKRRHREKRHTFASEIANLTKFRTRQSEGKTMKWLKRAISKSHRKSRQVVRKHANHLGLHIRNDSNDETRGRKPLPNETMEYFTEFFNRDGISRAALGMKD